MGSKRGLRQPPPLPPVDESLTKSGFPADHKPADHKPAEGLTSAMDDSNLQKRWRAEQQVIWVEQGVA